MVMMSLQKYLRCLRIQAFKLMNFGLEGTVFNQTYVTNREESSRNLERDLRRQMRLRPTNIAAGSHNPVRANRGRLFRLSRNVSGLVSFAVAAVSVVTHGILK
jgi:hypothetical protein